MARFKSIVKAYDINNKKVVTIDGGEDIIQATGYELYNQVCQALREDGFEEESISKISKVLVCYENLEYNTNNSPMTA